MKNLVIMAGGKSSRMGRDKVFLEIEGEAFLEFIYKNAKKKFDCIFISTDTEEHATAIRALDGLKDLNDENIILDMYPRCGPIGGICSVFEKTGVDKFAIIPTDVPRVNVDVLSVLFDLCSDVPCVLNKDNGDIEPLIGAYNKSCFEKFKECLDRGENSIHKALEYNGFKIYSADDLKNANPNLKDADFKKDFFNVNFPTDYETLQEG